MVKRVIFLLAIVTLCALMSVTTEAFASSSSSRLGNEILPMYVDTIYVNSDLYISGDTATAMASVRGRTSTVKRCSITIELQEKVGLLWVTRSTWSVSENGIELSVSRNCKVKSGKTYRVKAKSTVYTTTGSESASATSSSQTAP